MRFYQFPAVLLFSLAFANSGNAQQITGSTTINIDPDTGQVMVICETDLDDEAAAYYEPQVTCQVSGNGQFVASKTGKSPPHGDTSVSTAIIEFTGVVGTTYTATGTHSGTILYQDPDNPNPDQPAFYDAYNFAYYLNDFSLAEDTYEDSYDWFGPGPPTDYSSETVTTGDTYAAASMPGAPDHIAVSSDSTATLTCPYGTSLLRVVNYNILDINNYPVPNQVNLYETLSLGKINSCTQQQVAITYQCTLTPNTGWFQDQISASCPNSANLQQQGCGYSFPDQAWKYCTNSNGKFVNLGDIGPLNVTNTNINLGGNTTQFPAGTTFPH